MPSPTTERNQTISLAQSNWSAALASARKVSDPWHRCQSLAWVARFAPAGVVTNIAAEALSAARACDDPYKVAAASAWPLRALIERDQRSQIGSLLDHLLQTAETIPHPVNRLDALFLIWQGVFPVGSSGRHRPQSALLRACQNVNSWKGSYTLRDTAVMVAPDDMAEAQRIVAMMPESSYRRQTLRQIVEGKRLSPRPFFWEN